LIEQPLAECQIEYSLTCEDDTSTTFPQLLRYKTLIEDFAQNVENDYQLFIDNNNEQVFVLVNEVVLAMENFSFLKDIIKINNQEHLRITSGGGEIKISDLVITQTDVLRGSYENLFNLKLKLINDSLVFYNPTDTSTVAGSGSCLGSSIDDISRNDSQMDITTNIIHQ
jgi:hypothetical protein